jgi:hypothetical protein
VFHYAGFSPSQGQTPSGQGTPGTVALRGLQDRNLAIATSIPASEAFFSATGTSPNPAWSTHQYCAQTIPPTFGFICGPG